MDQAAGPPTSARGLLSLRLEGISNRPPTYRAGRARRSGTSGYPPIAKARRASFVRRYQSSGLASVGAITTVWALPSNYVPFGFLAHSWRIFLRLHQGLWHSLDANSVFKTPVFFRTCLSETRWDHATEIRSRYGLREFTDPSARFRLNRWLCVGQEQTGRVHYSTAPLLG
jgi:hypothetical protein